MRLFEDPVAEKGPEKRKYRVVDCRTWMYVTWLTVFIASKETLLDFVGGLRRRALA